MKEAYEITYRSTWTNAVKARETVAMTKAQAFRHAQQALIGTNWKAEIRPAK